MFPWSDYRSHQGKHRASSVDSELFDTEIVTYVSGGIGNGNGAVAVGTVCQGIEGDDVVACLG